MLWYGMIWYMFEDILYSTQLEEGKPLPSPQVLKGRIIIKNKKLKPEQEQDDGEFPTAEVLPQQNVMLDAKCNINPLLTQSASTV